MDLTGRLDESLGEFELQTSSGRGQPQFIFGPWGHLAASDSTVWYGPGDRFELQEFTTDRRLLRVVRLDRPARPVTQLDREAYERDLTELSRGTPDEAIVPEVMSQARFAPEFPHHFDIVLDAEGNLWVQDYQPMLKPVPRSWTVFDARGRYLGDVLVPSGLTVHEIGNDYVLGRATDELGVESVVMFPLHKP
jgi:hypothetical protein